MLGGAEVLGEPTLGVDARVLDLAVWAEQQHRGARRRIGGQGTDQLLTGVRGAQRQFERRGGLVVLCGGGAEHGVGVAGLAEGGRRGDHHEAIDGGVELADRGWILIDDDAVGDGGVLGDAAQSLCGIDDVFQPDSASLVGR